jgi:hypothetical protein
MAVFWVVVLCSLVEVYQCFRRPYCHHHQGDEIIMLMIDQIRHAMFVYVCVHACKFVLFTKYIRMNIAWIIEEKYIQYFG